MLSILQDAVKGPKGHMTNTQWGETLSRTRNGSSVRPRWAQLQARLEWVGVPTALWKEGWARTMACDKTYFPCV